MALILAVFFQVFSSYISMNILRRNKRINVFEVFGVMAGGLLIGWFYQYIGIFASLLTYVLLIIVCCLKEKIYRAIIYCSLAMIITVFSDHIATMIRMLVFGKNELTINEVLSVHTPIYYCVGLLISVLITFILKKFYEEKDSKVTYYWSALSLFIWITYQTSIFLGRYLGDKPELIILNLIFLGLYLIIVIIALCLYMVSIKRIYEIKKREAEYQSMHQYTEEMERQYTEIRKFRHDYLNILSSLEGYITDGDLEGLKKYFNDKIKRTSKELYLDSFKFGNVEKIKINEIKSIFASKLIQAQNMGIDTTFEATEVIESINMDTVLLVRALGILIDNSIEELQSLGYGKLGIAVIKDIDDIVIIIQNTCRKQMPRLHVLKQQYYSTKGENRGVGLNNYADIIDKSHNVISETTIKDEVFMQKIIINDEG